MSAIANANAHSSDNNQMLMMMGLMGGGKTDDMITKLLIVFSNEMKPLFTEFIGWVRTVFIAAIYSFCSYCLTKFKMQYFKPAIDIDNISSGSGDFVVAPFLHGDMTSFDTSLNHPTSNIVIKNSVHISAGLVKYLVDHNRKTATFTKVHDYSVSLVTCESYEKAYVWKKCSINYGNIKITIPHTLSIVQKSNGDILSVNQIAKPEDLLPASKVRSFTDLMPNDKFRDFIRAEVDKLYANMPDGDKEFRILDPVAGVKLMYPVFENGKTTGTDQKYSLLIALYGLKLGDSKTEETFIATMNAFKEKNNFTRTLSLIRALFMRLYFPNIDVVRFMYELEVFNSIKCNGPPPTANVDGSDSKQRAVGKSSSTYEGECKLFEYLTDESVTNPCIYNYELNKILKLKNHAEIMKIMNTMNSNATKLFAQGYAVPENVYPASDTIHVKFFTHVAQKVKTEFNSSVNFTSPSGSDLLFRVKSLNGDLPDAEFEEFIKFIKTPIAKTDGKKIAIFQLSFEKKEEFIECDNPEYKRFEEELSQFSGPSGDAGGDDDEVVEPKRGKKRGNSAQEHIAKLQIENLMKGAPTSKKIREKIVKKTLVCTRRGETIKKMQNVFLSDEVHQKFIGALSNFKNNKALMADLDVPNKLNFLIHGPPGTGKSTSVSAAATYLGYDLYYVDTSNMETNDELQQIFDYIPKNCPGGGILVFEDADASCPVLLQRKDRVDEDVMIHEKGAAIADTKDNKTKITLECWLNIMQGLLTPDNLVTFYLTNYPNKLDTAFRREGRIDCTLELVYCDRSQIRGIFKRFIRKDINEDVLNMIEDGKYAPVSIISRCTEFVNMTDANHAIIMKPFIRKQLQSACELLGEQKPAELQPVVELQPAVESQQKEDSEGEYERVQA